MILFLSSYVYAGNIQEITRFDEGIAPDKWVKTQGLNTDTFAVDTSPTRTDDGKGIRLSSHDTSVTRAVLTLPAPLDLSTYQAFYLEFYADQNADIIDDVAVQFANTRLANGHFHCLFLPSTVNSKQNRMKQAIDKRDCSPVPVNGKTPDWSEINQVRIYVRSRVGVDANVTYDRLSAYTNQLTRPKILLTFDDGLADHYTQAFPVLSEKGLKGTAYVIMKGGSAIGVNQGYMTKDQVQQLYNASWNVSSHASPALTSLSLREAKEEIRFAITKIEENGWKTASRHFAYPQGKYTQNLAEYIAPLLKTARTVEKTVNSAPLPNPYTISAWSINRTDSVQSLKDFVQRCVDTKTVCVLTFHGIKDNPSDIKDYSAASFSEFVNYVSDLKNSNTADVLTASDLFVIHSVLTATKIEIEQGKWAKAYLPNGRLTSIPSRAWRYNGTRILLLNNLTEPINSNVTIVHSKFNCSTIKSLSYTSHTGKYTKTYSTGEFTCNPSTNTLSFFVTGIETGENNKITINR